MSSDAYASMFLGLGKAHVSHVTNVPKPKVSPAAGSGSSSRPDPENEKAVETLGASGSVNPSPDVKKPSKKKRKKEERKAEKAEKKAARVKTTPGSSKGKAIAAMESGLSGDRVGDHSIWAAANIMTTMAPTEEWERMTKSGLMRTFNEVVVHWGKLGATVACLANMAVEVEGSDQTQLEEQQARISALQTEVGNVKLLMSGMQTSLKKKGDDLVAAESRSATLQTEKEKAEKDAADLRAEVERLKKELAEREPEKAVIEKYKKSEEYDKALAGAGIPEVIRSWKIAERHIKTDPKASFESFWQLFLKAKKDVEKGLPEPDFYEGPTPSFISSAATPDPAVNRVAMQTEASPEKPDDEQPEDEQPEDEQPEDEINEPSGEEDLD
ncbi:uncharacterized protein LOC108213543 [Daucus carota subsp. sativus]|uniref:uncharacterized protein LOC108213543 n=1 Tax=Daucus carota subsp. sativus TaxID=79200 RepID=UPI0007EF5FB0|nr:PREDICTED: uncharacterized protein LOC108213543 isoform X2 [Daucus carota subsp. sativus]XP_017240836.1 PREDICTED: uncharacterized protein LOC108213543 isoform X2 [Daucus carota subsp. sativus]XP_017240837.1 PREDICTED: uncharacterized protein LOC108213543 isoform X2 [Daucus carota subsp. sativus]